jgi:FkbM family methyltransferase
MSMATKMAGARAIMAFDNWPTLLLGRMLNRNTGLVVYRKSNLEILIDHRGGDETGTRACIVSDMYRRYVPLLKVKNAATVLDIGANGGGFPLMLRLQGIPIESVVCVEMNPATYSRLLVNLQTNLGFNAVGINAAACGSDSESEILLTPTRGSTGYGINGNVTGLESPHVAVKTITLDALYNTYFAGRGIDICKIDIEGAEYDLFASTDDDLVRKIRYLIMEFHDDSKTPALASRLAELGFTEMKIGAHERINSRTEVRAFRGPEALS